jgi:hypothetical protein
VWWPRWSHFLQKPPSHEEDTGGTWKVQGMPSLVPYSVDLNVVQIWGGREVGLEEQDRITSKKSLWPWRQHHTMSRKYNLCGFEVSAHQVLTGFPRSPEQRQPTQATGSLCSGVDKN